MEGCLYDIVHLLEVHLREHDLWHNTTAREECLVWSDVNAIRGHPINACQVRVYENIPQDCSPTPSIFACPTALGFLSHL